MLRRGRLDSLSARSRFGNSPVAIMRPSPQNPKRLGFCLSLSHKTLPPPEYRQVEPTHLYAHRYQQQKQWICQQQGRAAQENFHGLPSSGLQR